MNESQMAELEMDDAERDAFILGIPIYRTMLVRMRCAELQHPTWCMLVSMIRACLNSNAEIVFEAGSYIDDRTHAFLANINAKNFHDILTRLKLMSVGMGLEPDHISFSFVKEIQ